MMKVSKSKRTKLLLIRRQCLALLLASDSRKWVKDINKKRQEKGIFNNLIAEMRLTDTESFFNFFRMSPAVFDQLLSIVGPSIQKKTTNFRETISAAERLSITLRFLASGDSMTTLAFMHRVGLSTVSTIISETCEGLWMTLMPTYLKRPTTEEWKGIAEGFESIADFPNCVGALDGKHVIIQAPEKSGSLYYNYKGSYSIVLMAACDARYTFTYVNIGAYGKQNDSSVFMDTEFGQAVTSENIDLPPDQPIGSGDKPLPYVFVADEAFPLKRHIMRPFPGRDLDDRRRAFNLRLCRARRFIENVFGILAARWRILRRAIIASVKTVERIVKAVVCLHNFVSRNESNSAVYRRHYLPENFVDQEVNGRIVPGKWREETITGLQSIGQLGSNTYSKNAKAIREEFTDYFVNYPLPWQNTVINRF